MRLHGPRKSTIRSTNSGIDPVVASRQGIEIWKPVLDYEGLYEVSNIGNIRSVENVITRADGQRRSYGGRVLRASPDAYGYPRVTLSDKANGRGYLYRKVAHLVWEAFFGKHDQRLLRHLDDDKRNSCLYNLQPGSHKQNMEDAFKNNPSRYGEPSGFDPLSSYGF